MQGQLNDFAAQAREIMHELMSSFSANQQSVREAAKKLAVLHQAELEWAEKTARIDELTSRRGDAIGGGKGGIVMSYEEVEQRLDTLRKERETE